MVCGGIDDEIPLPTLECAYVSLAIAPELLYVRQISGIGATTRESADSKPTSSGRSHKVATEEQRATEYENIHHPIVQRVGIGLTHRSVAAASEWKAQRCLRKREGEGAQPQCFRSPSCRQL